LISTIARVPVPGPHSASISSGSGRCARGAPQRIIRRRQQHLLAGVQQCAQREVDQFADAVADEHPLDVGHARAARMLARQNRLARGFQPLLVAIRIAVGEVRGDRGRQVRRRAKSESPRVADVELQHRMACGLQRPRVPGQCPADFVADFGKTEAGMNGDRGHGCKRPRVRAC
jgi:hypothetical protein